MTVTQKGVYDVKTGPRPSNPGLFLFWFILLTVARSRQLRSGRQVSHKNIASLQPKIATITSELETHPSNRYSEVWRHQRIASLNRRSEGIDACFDKLCHLRGFFISQ